MRAILKKWNSTKSSLIAHSSKKNLFMGLSKKKRYFWSSVCNIRYQVYFLCIRHNWMCQVFCQNRNGSEAEGGDASLSELCETTSVTLLARFNQVSNQKKKIARITPRWSSFWTCSAWNEAIKMELNVFNQHFMGNLSSPRLSSRWVIIFFYFSCCVQKKRLQKEMEAEKIFFFGSTVAPSNIPERVAEAMLK